MGRRDDFLAQLRGDSPAPSGGGSGRDNYLASLRGEVRDAPNLLEKGAAAVAETPVIGDVLSYLGRFGNVGLNAFSAAQSALAGEGGRALERLGRAGETLPHLIPFTPGPDAETFTDPGDVLNEMGVTGELGRVDIPMLGAFTGRGLLKFGLGVATDPLIYTRIGGVTPKGSRRLAAKRTLGTPTKGMLGEAVKTGKVPSTLGTAARRGERAALTFAGQPVRLSGLVPGVRTGAISEKVLEGIGRATVFARTRVFPRFVTRTGNILDTVTDRLALKVGREVDGVTRRFEGMRESIVKDAERAMEANPGFYASLDDAIEDAFNKVAKAAEEGGDPVVRFQQAASLRKRADKLREELSIANEEIAARTGKTVQNPDAIDVAVEKIHGMESEARALEQGHRLKSGQIAEARKLVARYKKDGHSPKEAWQAAGQVINHGAHPDFAVIGVQARNAMRDFLKLEIDSGVAIQALQDPGVFYLLHWVKPQRLVELGFKSRRRLHKRLNDWFGANPSAKRRGALWRGRPLHELNEWARTHLPEVGAAHKRWAAGGKRGANPSNIFENDPLLLAMERGKRTKQSVTAGRSVEAGLKDFGVQVADLTEEAVEELVGAGWMRGGDIVAKHKLRTHAGPRGEPIDLPELRKGFREAVKAEGGFADEILPTKARSIRALQAGKDVLRQRPTRLGFADDVLVHPEVARAMDVTMQRWMDPGTPNALLKLFDKATQMWKGAVTTFWPEFHARNFASNIWANYLGDVRNPAVYIQASRLMHDLKATGGTKRWSNLGGLTTREVIDHMSNGGALGLGHSFVGVETGTRGLLGRGAPRSLAASPAPSPIGTRPLSRGPGAGGAAKTLASEAGPSAAFVAATGNPAGLLMGTRMGRNFGQLLESHAKIAHVVDKLRRGWSVDEAILSAKKYLFDYADLTPFERAVMRRIVPFYTWTRKNLPLQIEALVTRPGKIAVLGHLQRAVNDDINGPVDTTVIPDWMQRRWFGASKNDDGAVDVFAGLGVGTEDLALFDRPHMEFLSMLNPVFKGILQAWTERDFWRDIPLDRAEIAPTLLGKLPKPFLDHIGYREVKNVRTGETMFARANPRWLNFIRALPGPGALSRFASTAERLAESEITEGQPDPLFKHYLSFRRIHITPTRQAINMLVAEREMVRDQLATLRRQGVVEQSKRTFIERDMVTDPRARQAKSDQQRLYLIQRSLGRLYAQERKEFREEFATSGLRRGTRSLGR